MGSLGSGASLGAKADGLARLAERFPGMVPEFESLPLESLVVGGQSWLDDATRALTAVLTQGAADASAPSPLEALSADVALTTEAKARAEALAHRWGAVAVRTSALAEDGAEHSFAGVYETRLHVDASAVEQALLDCLRSLISDRVVAYAAARGITQIPVGGSIVVQRMAFARRRRGDLSGVMFTQTGRGDLEVVYSGDSDDGVVRGDVALTLKVPAVDPVPSAALLARGKVPPALVRIGREIQATHGPTDVEWAARGRTVWLLQWRPITSTGTDSTIAWDSSNIGENYPGVTLPLTYSFIRGVYAEVYPAFFRLLGRSDRQLRAHESTFAHTLGFLHGKVHYQIDNWFDMAAMLPGGRANQEFFAAMLQPVKEGERKRRPRPGLRGGLALVGGMARFIALLATSQRRSRRFKARFDRLYPRYRAIDFDSLSADAALKTLAAIRSELLSMWAVPILNDVRLMVAHGLLKRSFGPDRHGEYLDFLTGLTDRASIAPLEALAALGSRLKSAGVTDALAPLSEEMTAEVDEYLRRFGGRAPDELQLENPRLGDDKAMLVGLALMASTAPARPRITANAGGSPLLRLIGRHVRSAIDYRERFRFNRAQVFGLAREAYLCAGSAMERAGAIETAHDVFWLTHDEVDGAVFGHAWSNDLRETVRARKLSLADHEAHAAQLSRRVVGSGPLAPAALTLDHAPTGAEVSGQGVSQGRFTGEVLVLNEFDPHAVVTGKVLVTGHVDPGWTLLFVAAGAIVTERGNALSHVAIIGRELGIPVIVAAQGATTTLITGQEVTVDGSTGSVDVHAS